jgi:uncharacterized protein (TIGR03435 family)
MRQVAVAIAVLWAMPGPLHAQRFDVASVRQNRQTACAGRWDFRATHGTVTAVNAPLVRIISRAYELTDDRVSGPGWLDSECYDIRAKAASPDATNAELMQMLRALLAERVHLVARRDSEQKPVLALVVDKSGLKLQPYSTDVRMPPAPKDGGILFMARHMPDLCERLGKVTGRPVIDKTGLDGDYMIVLTYPPFSAANGDLSEGTGDIFSALRDQLGLKLEAQRGNVEVLRIDRVEKVPTGN